jgi:hypothetical protein
MGAWVPDVAGSIAVEERTEGNGLRPLVHPLEDNSMAKEAESRPDPVLFSDDERPLAEGKGRIRPRARLLRTIGAELISSEVVAVIELVRNSYDADATRVDLVFNYPEDPERASLEIRDNGHGMSREIVLGPWLEPATDHKSGFGRGETAGDRSPHGRRRLGSKGVGRFAVQRLGAELKLLTRAAGSMTEVVAWFDWKALETGKYLDELRDPMAGATSSGDVGAWHSAGHQRAEGSVDERPI